MWKTHLLVSTLAIVGAAALAQSPDYYEKNCEVNRPNKYAAIMAFCDWQDGLRGFDEGMFSPNVHADHGVIVQGDWVAIHSQCDLQWIPKPHCLSQFFDMCVSLPNDGLEHKRAYGTENCQIWATGSSVV